MTDSLGSFALKSLTFVGAILLVISISELMRKSEEAEKYYRSARPLLGQLLSSQAGGEDAPAVPVVELEDRIRLAMSQTALDRGWSFTTLHWMIIAGVTLTFLGSILRIRASPPGARTSDREPDSGQR